MGYKVLIGETNVGEELDIPTELDLVAANVEYIPQSPITASNAQAAILQAAQFGTSLPRFPFILIHNGTMSNNQNVGWSNLANSSPLIVPTKARIAEFVLQSPSTDADGAFELRKNTTGGSPLFTFSFTNLSPTIFVPSAIDFEQGDILYVKYIDNGGNINDAVICIWWQSVP